MATQIRSSRIAAALLAGAALVVASILLVREARAGDEEVNAGWTVEQNGAVETYLWKDRWRGSPNPAGFTITNEGTQVSVFYYGTFRVTERRR